MRNIVLAICLSASSRTSFKIGGSKDQVRKADYQSRQLSDAIMYWELKEETASFCKKRVQAA